MISQCPRANFIHAIFSTPRIDYLKEVYLQEIFEKAMKQMMLMSALGAMAFVMEEAQAFLNSSPLVNHRSPRCFRLKATECSRRLGAKRVPTMRCAPDRDGDDPTFLKGRGDAGHVTRQGWIQVGAVLPGSSRI